jgi:hypothetical protein
MCYKLTNRKSRYHDLFYRCLACHMRCRFSLILKTVIIKAFYQFPNIVAFIRVEDHVVLTAKVCTSKKDVAIFVNHCVTVCTKYRIFILVAVLTLM